MVYRSFTRDCHWCKRPTMVDRGFRDIAGNQCWGCEPCMNAIRLKQRFTLSNSYSEFADSLINVVATPCNNCLGFGSFQIQEIGPCISCNGRGVIFSFKSPLDHLADQVD